MKPLLFAIVLSLSTSPVLFGQVITVTAQGFIEQTFGTPSNSSIPILDGSVQSGTPFTFTYTIDPSASTDSFGEYVSNPPFGATLQVGDYSFAFSGDKTTVTGNGYDLFSGYDATSGGLTDILASVRLQGTSLGITNQTLSGIKVFPVSDFNIQNSLQITVGSSPQEQAALGLVTSYTVAEIAPEPATWVSLGLGFAVLFFVSRRGGKKRA
jgi:hypothetical protein